MKAGGSARLREDHIMTCASHAAPLDMSGGSSLLHGLFTAWQHHAVAIRTQHRLALLDDRALSDLGLPRDAVEPPHPRDSVDLWLNRLSAGG